ncbi:uncharacterized protein HRG_08427 [Hirsutella rhossiliensis]|uniref:Vomeronasal type-1 receptor n=1 Tax=Hirsutella rhossiliensis TaxID=111463 RepID=A0A9P8MRV3_9HYPO|nr:uncharacterized protein HRG_08427 [Hirsutella rhossiliensis]KAH0960272.1 hypothetical protein HRG_08427 [Hirsutella rhossiliensis]
MQVCQARTGLSTCVFLAFLVVEYPQNCPIAQAPTAKVFGLQHHGLGHGAGVYGGLRKHWRARRRPDPAWSVRRMLVFVPHPVLQWCRRDEQAPRCLLAGFMMNGAQQIVGNILASCFSLITIGPPGVLALHHGRVAFRSIIIKSLGLTTLQTRLLSSALGFCIDVVLLSSVWLAKKTGQNLLVMPGFVVPSFIGTIRLMTAPISATSHKVGLLFDLTPSSRPAGTLSLSLSSRSVAGQTKKGVAVTVSFIAWASENSVGPQLFFSWDKPRYLIVFATQLGYGSFRATAITGFAGTHASEQGRRGAREFP